ncbi:TetR family transcriptional regulator [Actinoplanes sp. NBRC 14428]|uniref:TetR family transcriptional regulator n=1 Tax=Pseudosporangium ferrugineum TaxID=439699 RepID=A0A2T0RHH9_9ACTN|nr:TetR/AcrR family transcriptional regulator [Pseudosporangium ferrugineum]PRY20599.1 TetR family transcriptional regulator [Pseudosporangium ferrugineum]BCJ51413.1 TetR family transcriptional regulator [Actinoplanes sp. NBRC 14428]
MPRIDAPTIAEHRAQRRRVLLDAARALLVENPHEAPSLTAVATRAGLPRSSVYEYFPSGRDMLLELMQEVLPNWSHRVNAAMDAAGTPGEKVLAYAAANLRLVAAGEHALATALIQSVPGDQANASTQLMHEQMSRPLCAALEQLGLPDPAATASLIGSVVYTASRMIEDGADMSATDARVRELLAPFLLGQVDAEQGPA